MTRLVAVVVAIALVAGAIVIRNAIDDDGGDGDGDHSSRVVCALELAAVCDELDGLDVTIEDSAKTADALVTAAEGIGVWVTYEPWPVMVDEARVRAGRRPMFSDRDTIARSRLVAVAPTALDGCDWRCLGDGSHRLGARDLDSGLGVLHVAAAANGWFGRADYASNDFDAAFRGWLGGFAASVTADRSPVTRLLQGPFFDVALSFEAEAAAALGDASEDRRARLTLLYPEPVAHVDVAFLDVAGGGDGVRDRLTSLLREAGWDASSAEPGGLPPAGVVTALRELVA